MRSLLLLFACMMLFMNSCTLYKRKKYERFRIEEGSRIEKCIKPWYYINLTDQRLRIRVLNDYSKGVHGETPWPNFLIGISESGDTVGVLDKYYSSPLSKNETVVVVGGDWEVDDQIFKYARYQYSSNPKDNDLLCKIDFVFRGRILLKTN